MHLKYETTNDKQPVSCAINLRNSKKRALLRVGIGEFGGHALQTGSVRVSDLKKIIGSEKNEFLISAQKCSYFYEDGITYGRVVSGRGKIFVPLTEELKHQLRQYLQEHGLITSATFREH